MPVRDTTRMHRTAAKPPRTLLRSFDAVATAVLPPAGGVGPGATNAASALERHWPLMQPRARATVAAMVATLELCALVRSGRPLRALSRERRTRLCDHLEFRATTPLRSAFLGVKTLVLVLAAADPDVERSLGTDTWPPNLIRAR